MVVESCRGSFRKYDQGPFRRVQNFNGSVHRLAINTFPIDAETTNLMDRPGRKTVLMEQMPTGHGKDVSVGLACGKTHHNRIGRPAMVRSQHDTVPGR